MRTTKLSLPSLPILRRRKNTNKRAIDTDRSENSLCSNFATLLIQTREAPLQA